MILELNENDLINTIVGLEILKGIALGDENVVAFKEITETREKIYNYALKFSPRVISLIDELY